MRTRLRRGILQLTALVAAGYHDIRDAVMDFVTDLAHKTELPTRRLTAWLGVARAEYFDWKHRYGRANERNAQVPRGHWLTVAEMDCIIRFYETHPLESYRRLAYMVMDQDIVAVSPSIVDRVLFKAGPLNAPSRGFREPRSCEALPIDPVR